ncbi:MAG: hemolysin family protein [Deferribacterota bacterium]|nr:hemolysin family protein [Deferribacterota bacterium]
MAISLELEIIFIILCLLLSAFFSATETALTSISEFKTRKLLEEEDRGKAKALTLWLLRPNRILITILVGNNLVNILSSVLATDLSIKIFGSIEVALTTGIMTFLILLLAEITPKTLAKHNYEKLSIYFINILKLFYYLFYPITYLLEYFVIFLSKITGIKIERIGPTITEDEIEFLIKVGGKEGILEYQKREMLHNIFEMSDMTVKEVMVPRTDMLAVDVEESKDEIIKVIREYEFSRIPVFEGRVDNIIGILYVKDLLKYSSDTFNDIEIRSILRKPYFVPETKKIDELLREFQAKRIHMAIVIDEYGGVAGLVTLEDILEEIVGEIRDEFDNEEDIKIVKVADNVYKADARININDFLEYFNIEKNDITDDCETLAGLIYSLAGKIPEIGEEYTFDKYILKVLSREGRKLRKVEIKLEDSTKENVE